MTKFITEKNESREAKSSPCGLSKQITPSCSYSELSSGRSPHLFSTSLNYSIINALNAATEVVLQQDYTEDWLKPRTFLRSGEQC